MGLDDETSIARLLAAGRLAPQTKENYILRVRAYLRRTGVTPDQFVRGVGADPKPFEEDFINFIGEVSKTSAPSTTAFWRDSLRRFLEINRVRNVDWSYLNEFLPRVRKSGRDRAPTAEEVRKLVSIADFRTKCLILFLCSSGARIGSVDCLHWRDFQEVTTGGRKLARVTIYGGEPEEYHSYVTPECWRYLQLYRETRENMGEKVEPSSALFICEVNKKRFSQKRVRPVDTRSLKNQLANLMAQAGMRLVLEERKNHRSYQIKQAHGFRKFFKTTMEMSGVKPIITEMLMGHAIGVARSYMKPTQEEFLGEYSKAIDKLTFTFTQGNEQI